MSNSPDRPGTADQAASVFAGWMPPHVALMQLVAAKWVSQPLLALTELGVADLLKDGPRQVDDLAAATNVRADPLRRCLRAAAAVGVFAEQADGAFALTPMARHLCTGVPLSLRDLTLLVGAEPMQRSFAGLMSVLRTGRPSFEDANGAAFFDHLDRDPGLGRIYQGAWAPLADGVGRAAAQAVDFGAFNAVADLGGGNGTLLKVLLERFPGLRGVLVDRPATLATAVPDLRSGPLAERAELRPGLLPDAVPTDVDAYIIKNTLHCFDDGLAGKALRAVRDAIGDHPDRRLFLIESVILSGNEYDWGRFIDIEVMVNCGGRVHSLDQWRELLADCGFDLSAADSISPPQWLLTAAPR